MSNNECEHGHFGGCGKEECSLALATARIESHLEAQECAEEVIYAAVNFLRRHLLDRETEELALKLERVALDIENGIRLIAGNPKRLG
jgi:hypothetical protein